MYDVSMIVNRTNFPSSYPYKNPSSFLVIFMSNNHGDTTTMTVISNINKFLHETELC